MNKLTREEVGVYRKVNGRGVYECKHECGNKDDRDVYECKHE
jgi:hypothetical protein